MDPRSTREPDRERPGERGALGGLGDDGLSADMPLAVLTAARPHRATGVEDQRATVALVEHGRAATVIAEDARSLDPAR